MMTFYPVYQDKAWMHNQASTSKTSTAFKLMYFGFYKYLMIKVTSANLDQEVSSQSVQHQRDRC